MKEKLPIHFRKFVEKYPDVWEAHQKLTIACAEAGPLDRKTRELIKVAISGTAGMETALQRHAIMAVKEGASEEEVYQTILMLITTVGFPKAAAAMKWAQSSLEAEAGSNRDK
ncbi:MAG: carboxymuconolactone decarboxylase family protein [Sedimentisphaerales bacterium]|jgi:4-carboxymuconolactone decarboxylase